MRSKPLPLSEVEAKCPVGKDCSYKTLCTLANVFSFCSIYKETIRKAAEVEKEGNPNKL